ncbi:hypothetical protein [Candidatus Uabimicrobium sp. HlEnr_7]|uniref:hypothetical protein n=1 Tax=Candidatus Uabimicrobium helgolandensis TaxID=3095367 RepID=UPI0035560502
MNKISQEGIQSTAIGFILALGVFAFPYITFIFSYFVILIHEIGHAAFGILFAYPSIPAFDFRYGGGFTTIQTRSSFFLVVVFLLFAVGLVKIYDSRRLLKAAVALIILYTFLAFTGIHKQIILFMGHGMELIIAGIFIYRGLSGSAVIHKLERPLYSMLGFFIVFYDMRFAYRLAYLESYRTQYGNAKGGGHWMDFSQLATYMQMSLSSIAFLFMLCCILPVVISFLLHIYREDIISFIRK